MKYYDDDDDDDSSTAVVDVDELSQTKRDMRKM